MSRIGFLPVTVPAGVMVSVEGQALRVKGSKGELIRNFEPLVNFDIKEGKIQVNRTEESKQAKSMHGLYRSLLHNMINGVSRGFTKSLTISGVGFRGEVRDGILLLNLGFSNQIEYEIPEGITLSMEGNSKIIVSGIDKAFVGLVASEIRRLRPPEPYKGKGVRYENESVRRKVGKSGVK